MAAVNESTKYTHLSNLKVGTSSGGGAMEVGGNTIALDAATTISAPTTISGATTISAATTLSDMTPGTGISTGTGTICEHSVTKVGGVYKTEILVDLTGLNSGGTIGDIIGKDGGTANCHIGQITAAVNGTIIAGKLEGHEAPAGGDPDINLYSATEGTGAQDAAIADLTETQLVDAGDMTASSVVNLTAWPAADEYIYMTCGAVTDADYTAGRFLLTLYGV